MAITFEHAQQSYVGRARIGSPNEDAVAVHVANGPGSTGVVDAVFSVADGMGGGQDGQVASQRVLAGLLGYMADGRMSAFAARHGIPEDMIGHVLKEAVVSLNGELIQLAAGQGKQMGTTLDALVVAGDRYWIAHVGDSRVYLMRHERIYQLTADHTAVAELVRMNVPRARALELFGTNVVTNILGVSASVHVDILGGHVKPNDRFVLCTDGLTGQIHAADILEMVTQARTCQEACDTLVREANSRDGLDNITVLLAQAVGDT